VHGEKNMKEEGQRDRSTNYQIRSDLNVEFGGMKLWDNPRIIEANVKKEEESEVVYDDPNM